MSVQSCNAPTVFERTHFSLLSPLSGNCAMTFVFCRQFHYLLLLIFISWITLLSVQRLAKAVPTHNYMHLDFQKSRHAPQPPPHHPLPSLKGALLSFLCMSSRQLQKDSRSDGEIWHFLLATVLFSKLYTFMDTCMSQFSFRRLNLHVQSLVRLESR